MSTPESFKEPAGARAGPRPMIIKLSDLLEPELPAREKMSAQKMEELKASLVNNGQLVPLIVVRRGDQYEIKDGHRRYIAAEQLAWRELRCEVFERDGLEMEAAKVAAMLDREDWNPAEEAMYYAQTMEKYSLDGEALCKLVRRSMDHISKRLVLYHGDPVVFEAVRDNMISMAVALELTRCEHETDRRGFLHSAVMGGHSSRIVKGWIDQWKVYHRPGAPPAEPGAPAAAPAPGSDAALLPPALRRECATCGGWIDQQNLIEVTIHNYEWARILKLVRDAQARAVEGGTHHDAT